MKLDGRNRIVYECDNAVKNKTAEGSVHTILNREGLEAMLLERSMCTKDMEHRVMNALNGIGEWYGPEIRDILYTHGKFRGYVFYKEMEPEPESIPSNPISNEITILADAYAFQNYQNIRYAEVMGARWKVNYVEVQYPRLRLTLGGVYNGPIPRPVPDNSGESG